MFSSLIINRLIMVLINREAICYNASVFLGWERLAHRISVKLSVQEYNDPGSPGNTLVGNYCHF